MIASCYWEFTGGGRTIAWYYNDTESRWELSLTVGGSTILYGISGPLWECCESNTLSYISGEGCATLPETVTVAPVTPCTCPPDPCACFPCTLCDNRQQQFPCQWRFVGAGFNPAPGFDCDRLNRNLLLSMTEPCVWEYDDPTDVHVMLDLSGANVILTVSVYSPPGNEVFVARYEIAPASWNCCGNNNLPLTQDGNVCGQVPVNIILQPITPCSCGTSGPPNCVNTGPCWYCLACEGSIYPAAWLILPEGGPGCFNVQWIVANKISNAPSHGCLCPYTCTRGLASAELLVYPHPNGIRKASLNFTDGIAPNDTYASYSTQNWNCCGTNILTLDPGSTNCNPAPTRTLEPATDCNCSHPGNWCSRRVLQIQARIMGMKVHTPFNGRLVTCTWRAGAGGVRDAGWFGTTSYMEDEFNEIELEVALDCSIVGMPLGNARWLSSGKISRNSGVIAIGNDGGIGTTSVCQPLFHDTPVFDLESEPGVKEPDVIQLTFTE